MRQDKDSNINLVSNYCIADSLYIPLLMASICKVDEPETIKDKIEQVNLFVDSFINIRTLSARSVTQSTIRDTIYDLVKEIRNLSTEELVEVLKTKYKPLDEFYDNMVLGNYSPAYMHYFWQGSSSIINPNSLLKVYCVAESMTRMYYIRSFKILTMTIMRQEIT